MPGLSQAELAEAAVCSVSYIRLLERGFDPRFSDVLPRVLRVLADLEQEASCRQQ